MFEINMTVKCGNVCLQFATGRFFTAKRSVINKTPVVNYNHVFSQSELPQKNTMPYFVITQLSQIVVARCCFCD